jgi:hypothetical protein
MTTEPADARARLRRYQEIGRWIRSEVWHHDTTESYRRHRSAEPEFWRAIDALVHELDKDFPPTYPSDLGL